MKSKKSSIEKLRDNAGELKESFLEIELLFGELQGVGTKGEKDMILHNIAELKKALSKSNSEIKENLDKIILIRPMHLKELRKEAAPPREREAVQFSGAVPKELEPTRMEKIVLKRFREEGEKTLGKRIEKQKKYTGLSSRIFSDISRKLSNDAAFKSLKDDLIKTNLEFTMHGYISVILLTTLISAIISFVIFLVVLFIKVESFPAISLVSENIGSRFIKIFWIIFVVPLATFMFMYLYPSIEKKSLEGKINQELPFATIHMSAISGSMIEPSKIFGIIISTKEYPNLEREFTKLINLVNIYGYDLVTATRIIAEKSPSRKLGDLLNSLATTITSGGDLPNFFDKRAQSLLFEYKLEREKHIKMSETFMDIYISVVIATPMILMLLLMIMKISGLGISVSSTMISIMMVLGVSAINAVFVVFLHLKQPGE